MNAHPQRQSEIIAALESNAGTIAAFFSAQHDHKVLVGDPEHWGPAHHLAHLTRTSRAITRGLRSQGLPLHPTGRSRPYAELIAVATAGVESAPQDRLLEMGRVVVIAPEDDLPKLVNAYAAASEDLRTAAGAWSEEDLDRHAMPHPLIGALTVREMLLFCVFHERHHLKVVRGRLEA
jgi:hypothetical protein